MENTKFKALLGHSRLLVAFGWIILIALPCFGIVVGVNLIRSSEYGTFVFGGIGFTGGLVLAMVIGLPYIILGQWIQVFVSMEQNTVDLVEIHQSTNRMLQDTIGVIKADVHKILEHTSERSLV